MLGGLPSTPGRKMRDTSLMTSNIPSSPLSNLNRPHILVQTHTFFSSCNKGWCRPQKNLYTNTRAHSQPTSNLQNQTQQRLALTPATSTQAPHSPQSRTNQPKSQKRQQSREASKQITYYYSFPLFMSNLVYVYFPFLTLVLFASDVSMLLFLLLLSKS